MSNLNFIEKIFSLFNKSKHNKQNLLAATQSLEALIERAKILDQKALNIKDNYPELSKKINDCLQTLLSIEPSSSVRAGKFEQQISVAITQVSTSLDKIFTSSDSAKLEQQISLLERNIRERVNADTITEE